MEKDETKSQPVSVEVLKEALRAFNLSALPFNKNEEEVPTAFVLKNLCFNGEIHFQEIHDNFQRLEFRNCQFTGAIAFEISQCDTSILFENCLFDADISYNSGNYKKYFGFISCRFSTGIFISGGEFYYLLLQDLTAIKIRIEGGVLRSFLCRRTKVKVSFIEEIIFALDYTGNFRFENIISNTIRIDGEINKETDLYFNNIDTFSFDLLYVDVIGRLHLSIINALNMVSLSRYMYGSPEYSLFAKMFVPTQTSFEIGRSNLGNTVFQNINFRSFNKFNVFESYLEGCIFSNVIWPKYFYSRPEIAMGTVVNSLPANNRTEQELLRDVYRQLKSAMNKQHDTIGSQFFHGLEMNAYNSTIQFRRNFGTKFILTLSYLTSNYGQSLLRPIISLIFFNGIMFYLLIRNGYVDKPSDLGSFIGTFVQYCNPLHKVPEGWVSWNYIIDVSMRIISSYIIYNFIRASRRFIK